MRRVSSEVNDRSGHVGCEGDGDGDVGGGGVGGGTVGGGGVGGGTVGGGGVGGDVGGGGQPMMRLEEARHFHLPASWAYSHRVQPPVQSKAYELGSAGTVTGST